MQSVIGFLIILGPLVVVHEFGHYLFARLFRVKAEIFSIGFGPRLWSRQMGETELRISLIPLGGFVKLLGEDRETPLTPEEEKRALHKQPAWKRFFIFFGGPLFNFLWAILVFMAILLIGEPQYASVVGRVVDGSVAAKAGLQSGDRVLSVNGKAVARYDQLLNEIAEHPGKPVQLEIERSGQATPDRPLQLTVIPASEPGFSMYGEQKPVGYIDGMMPNPRSSFAGVSNPTSPAGQAGIATGDQISEFNGKAVGNWEELEAEFTKAPAGSPVVLKVLRGDKGEPKEFTLNKPAGGVSMADAWGLHSSELFVERTIEKSPAEGAGLQRGDRLVGVGDARVNSFYELREAVQKSGEATGKVLLKWERSGQPQSVDITPTATQGKDVLLKATTQYTVGVQPMLKVVSPPTVIERIFNPFMLVYKATERVMTFSWRNLVSVGKMITGDVSVSTLGGPILIGKLAGESLGLGLITFLTTMAILSIGLGVLNLLPVPVLDGGHLVLLGIEAVRGKPLTMRQMEIIQGVGLVLILALMGLVIRNDIARLATF